MTSSHLKNALHCTPNIKSATIFLLQQKNAIFGQFSWFLNKQHKTLEIWFKRGENYLPHARRVFVERGLPEDLAYLAFIESGYNPYAYSRARAAGCWQFMSYTGRRFDLRYASWIDERRDPVRSAEAAASYLKLLYGIFNDWSLAIASYNAGEGKIGRAVRLTGAKNFFELAERNNTLRGRARLARETLNYVPRFMAMVKIAKKHELLGFDPMDFNQAQDLLQVKAKGPVSLEHLATAVGLDWKEFAFYNPSFRTRYVPAGQEAFVYVPQAKAQALNDYLAHKKLVVAETVTQRTEVSHKVRRGDTLSRLAQRYGTSVREIKKANNLRSNVIRIGQKLVITKEEQVVVAKVVKPLKTKDTQEITASADVVADNKKNDVKETEEQPAVELKPGQMAKTKAPVRTAPAKFAATAGKNTQSETQTQQALVTKAAPVEDAPKADSGRNSGKALVQGLLGLVQTHQPVAAPKGAPVNVQTARATTPAKVLQAPERRPVAEWHQMLAKADLAWGAPQQAKTAAARLQNRKIQMPAARPDRNAEAQSKVLKPIPAPTPSSRAVDAQLSSGSDQLAKDGSRVSASGSARTASAKAGHSIRRKINRTTYGSQPAAPAKLQSAQNSAPEKNMLETLNGVGKQIKAGFFKFFSWEEEQQESYKIRRNVAAATMQSSRT